MNCLKKSAQVPDTPHLQPASYCTKGTQRETQSSTTSEDSHKEQVEAE
jgi:hypothetical protein